MDRKSTSLLLLLLFLAAFLRLFMFGVSPPSLNWDEVSHGYNAYSILKTGSDQWSQKLPVFNFRAYGDYPTTLNLYLTIPFIAVFGLNEYAIRLPHAILGVLTVLSSFIAVYGLTKRKDMSLFVGFLVAIGPWYLFTSRSVLQANLSIFIFSTAMAFFFNKERSKYNLPIFFVLLFFSLFSYHTTRIFTPIFLIVLGAVYSKELLIYIKSKRSNGILAIGSFFIFFVFVGLIFSNPNSLARSSVLSIINDGAVNKIESLRNNSDLPEIVKKLIYNRPIYFLKVFANNYLDYFSPQFLFLKGGTQYQFSLPGFGLIPFINMPLFYIGLVYLVVKSLKDKNYRVLLFYLLLAPIPASITNERFAVVRATAMLPATEIVIALATFKLLEKTKGRLLYVLTAIYFVLTYVFVESYLINYFSKYSNDYSWSWQYGYKEVVMFINQNYTDYDKIIITKKYGEPHEYILFYMNWDPYKYQSDVNAVRYFQSNWYWVDSFDKFYFVNDWQIVDNLKTNKNFILESGKSVDCSTDKCILVTSYGNVPRGWKKIKTVNFLDGKPAFEIYNNR